MESNEKLKTKIYILIVSFFLIGILILLFFLDKSLEWNIYKIYSCIIANTWLFFIIPSFRFSFLSNKDKSLSEWFKIGFTAGSSRIILPLLIAPYYGIKYYKYNI